MYMYMYMNYLVFSWVPQVPAAAVIPAPIAYINVAAVKKLVVEFVVDTGGLTLSVCACLRHHPWVEPMWH